MGLKLHTATPFIVMALLAILIPGLASGFRRYGPTLLINQTPSEPVGVYRLVPHPAAQYRRGMYVVFPVPASLQPMVYGRGWLRNHIPFLKELLGLAGDRVCIGTHRVTVNDADIGPVFARDGHGEPLPQHPGCFIVPDGHFFAASRHFAKSFDGRYFGALPLSLLTGEARPVWTF